jgi:prevent-host-death family protein
MSADEGPKPIAAADLRRELGDVLDQVQWCGRKYVINRYGQGAGVLLGIEEYRELVAKAVHGAAPRSLRYRVTEGKRKPAAQPGGEPDV